MRLNIGFFNHKGNILSIILLISICIILLVVPFAVDSSMPFSVRNGNQFSFIYLSIFTTILIGVNLVLSNSQAKLSITNIDIFCVLILIYVLSHALVSNAFSAIEYYEISGLVILYIGIRVLGRKSTPWFFLVVLIATAGEAIYGNLQLYGLFTSFNKFFLITGSFSNPGSFSGFLVIVLPIAMGIYLFKNNLHSIELINRKEFMGQKWLTHLALVVIIPIILIIPAAESRAAWLATLVSTSYILAIRFDLIHVIKSPKFLKRIALISIPTIFLFMVGSLKLYQLKKESADGRLLIWKITTNMISEKPIFGHGLGKFKANYMDYQAAYFNKQSNTKSEEQVASDVIYAFNECLHITSELGLFGLVLFTTLIIFAFVSATKSKGGVPVTLARASLISFAVFSLFSYPLSNLPIKLILICLIAIISNFSARRFNSSSLQGIRFWGQKSAGISLIVAACSAIYFIQPIKSSCQTWKNGFDEYERGTFEESTKLYDQAYAILKLNGDFLQHYGKALSMSGRHKKAIDILGEAKSYQNNAALESALGMSYEAIGKYSSAEKAYLKAFYMAPSRFYAEYLLAKLYFNVGQHKKAKMIATKLINKEAKIESTAVIEIKSEMKKLIIMIAKGY